ncbi:MAG: 4-alpha-glucanotransferase [Planctomycetota bacterium]|jgi:predicted glycogen debranching enzyme
MDGIRAHTTPDSTDALPLLSLSRHVAGDATEGTRREWLATTGLGDYALGTTSLIATRRYHGLLIGAMRAPIGRRMLVPFVDEDVTIGTHRVTLGARRWSDGSLDPDGHRVIAGFALEGSTPTWTYEVGSARLEKRLVMLRDHRAVALVWTLVDAPDPISIDARIFVEHRGQHQLDPDASWLPESTPVDGGMRIVLPSNRFAATPTELFVAGASAAYTPAANWWRRHLLSEERARGYDALGSACHALTASLTLAPRASAALVIGLSPSILGEIPHAETILTEERARQSALLRQANAEDAPTELRSLVLASDAFIVARRRSDGREGRSIIAGFPWFEDWGRDAMLALPGLLLQTGRLDDAKLVIETFLDHVKDGLLPNRFPDETTEPEYHAADAPLLALIAATSVFRASNDGAWLADVIPALRGIIEHFIAGTQHGIGIDADGLVRAGEMGFQLTWMDAKVNGTVVTPRAGKPIELSALWIEALMGLAAALRVDSPAKDEVTAAWLETHAARAQTSFAKFWNLETQSFRDVLECQDVGGEISDVGDLLRPNQLFALAADHISIDSDWRTRALARISAQLATPLAVRTLAPSTRGYRGRYEGDQRSRDFAYHNGTAWPFLTGLRMRAELRADRARGERLAQLVLSDLSGQLRDGGLGSIAEIADGDAPHDSRGCPMQAWSVGCILDALRTARGEGFRSVATQTSAEQITS